MELVAKENFGNSLTKGVEYELLEELENDYIVIDDTGTRMGYAKDRFELKTKISPCQAHDQQDTKEPMPVEWFFDKIKSHFEDDGDLFESLLITYSIAKRKEELRMKDVWNTAHQAGRFEGKGIAEKDWQTWETYCNDNFNYEKK